VQLLETLGFACGLTASLRGSPNWWRGTMAVVPPDARETLGFACGLTASLRGSPNWWRGTTAVNAAPVGWR
jgi:hypothetical protein